MHDCVSQIYSLLNATNQNESNITNPFGDVDNLVFQGGGIKGIAYLGVLQQLLEEDKNIIKNAKRFAGTSAGSIVALYLGLGLDPNTEIKELLSQNYSQLLDDGLALKVAYNITDIFGGYKYKNFTVRDIVLTAIDYLSALEAEMKTNPGAGDIEDKITSLFVDVLQYYSSKFGTAYSVFMRTIGKGFAKDAAQWLIKILRAESKEEAKLMTQIKEPAPIVVHKKMKTKVFATNNATTTTIEQSVETTEADTQPQKTHVEESSFDKVLERACQQAFDKCQYLQPGQTVINTTTTKEGESPIVGHVKVTDQHNVIVGNSLTNTVVTNPNATGFPVVGAAALDTTELTGFEKIKDADVQYYKAQKTTPVINITDKSELVGALLHYSLAEMLWFIVLSQVDANGMKQQIGLFSGDVVKATLIEGAIQMKFKSLGRQAEYRPDFTFKELAEFTEEDKKTPLFKPFYILAFNPGLLRTEVFSIEHTPNVIVAEAVRASMSIPVFFTPVTVSENGAPRKIYFDNGTKSEEIHYMDGGILDNYPIWIFDDLKYLVNIPGWVPKRKVTVSNYRTLGFRILDETRIDIYTKPYYGPNFTQMKRISDESYESTFGYVMGSLFNADFGGSEENNFIHRGDPPRSVYVDNLGISSIAFTLSDTDKNNLITSGKQAVLNYKERAKNNFYGEGERYI